MYLYRFQVDLADGAIPVIIAARDDEHAFQLVEDELEKHFLKMPTGIDIILHEKKRLGQGTGFVLEGEAVFS
ncbi:DUF3906 family protein [Desmospora activa]|uniref:Uncharacterized protein DUF3906 n=1 Tax=Desmospora activa DSM 45169 TaxID=1121389 RepID=A0A2T4Z883_9BACL|nr:DUF3906 family protein [Desmospora activa]PTM58075.1 uncharacterized protein DUF3906 [Desmospora activa DSM 45169]